MSRLTGRPIEDKNYKVRKTKEQQWENAIQNCINKLGKLEDIEEELGCSLEIIFKALEESIIYFDNGMYSVEFCLENNSGTWYFSIYDNLTNNKDIVYLKDYRKTWWLKGEKENE